jgi:hypothetical protein
MDPIGYIPYYDSVETMAEIDIRGRFMMMSVDIEFTLMNILVYSSADPLNTVRKFKRMMMHEKIQNAISDLKKHKPKHYCEFADDLEKLWEFKEIRNDLAHNTLRFEQGKKPYYFEVIYVDEEQGIEHILTRQYSIAYIIDAVKRFRKLNMKLLKLQGILQNEFLLNNVAKKSLE